MGRHLPSTIIDMVSLGAPGALAIGMFNAKGTGPIAWSSVTAPRRWALSAVLSALTIAAFAWRLPRGASLGDEAYYANFYVAWLRAPIGDSRDLSPHQATHLILFPLIKLFAAFVPNLTGIILVLRGVYAAISLGAAGMVFVAARPEVSRSAALAAASAAVLFIPFGLPAPSYNTLGMLGSICSACCFLRLFIAAPDAPVRRWAVGAAAFGALQSLAYPTLAPAPLVVWAGCCFLVRRAAPARRRFAGALVMLAAAYALVGLLVVGAFGLERLQRSREFAAAFGGFLNLPRKLQMAASQLVVNPAFPALCLVAFLASAVRAAFPTRPSIGFLYALVLGGLLAYLGGRPSPTLAIYAHGVVFLLCAAGLPVLRHLVRPAAARFDQFLAVWWLAAILGGLLTGVTSNNGLWNFPIGALGAVPVVLLDWRRSTATKPIPLDWALACGLVLAALATSWTVFYGETGGRLTTRIGAGPFAGLRTTATQAKDLEDARQVGAAVGSPDEYVGTLGHPGSYLFGAMKLRTPCSFPVEPGNAAVETILERFYSDPTNLPENMLWYGYPTGASRVQREVLRRNYALQSADAQLLVFRRRDVATHELRKSGVPWDEGLRDDERDAR